MKLKAAACIVHAVVAASVCGAAYAQSGYPARPVRVIVPSSPGGGTDILSRLISPAFAERLGQNVIVDNRPGAGSIIGNDVVAKSPPDGYTVLMGISTLAILPAMHKKLPYDALRDLQPITQVISAPNILVVHPSMPVKTVKELVAFARKRPGEINYGSAGLGTNPHLSMELFLSMTDTKMVHVAYKGLGPALVDLIAGQVVVATSTMLAGLPHVKANRLRALATTGSKRSTSLPDLPTVSEAGVKGYEAVQWYGLFAPAKTPKDIVAKLHDAMTGALQSAQVKEKLATDGAEPVGSTPEEFARFLRSETEKWGKVVRAAGIQPR